MPKLRVHCFSISLDGYGAGPDQDLEHPLGVGGLDVFAWQFATKTHQELHVGGASLAGETGVDDDLVARGFEGIGAWIIGRNMFGPVRGPWLDESWKGWWGPNPVYHMPVFVLTHHPRASITMEGGTTFHFVTDGIHAALERARDAAKRQDVRLGGGGATVQEYLRARLVDEMHVCISPTLLGRGERLFEDVDLPRLGYEVTNRVSTANASHVFFALKR